MSNTFRERKSPVIFEDTDTGASLTWSVRGARLAKITAIALFFSGLAACGMQNDSMDVGNIAATTSMSIPVYGSKDDCNTAANIAWIQPVNGVAQELNFSCESVDINALAKTDIEPSMANTLAAPANAASASTTPAPVHANSGGSNLLMYYLFSRHLGSIASPGFTPSTAGGPAASGFINSAGGKMSFGSAATFPSPTNAQYAGLGKNGGVMQTSMIGSKLASAASYNAAKSSIASKSSVGSSVGHSSGGRGGGGGGGG